MLFSTRGIFLDPIRHFFAFYAGNPHKKGYICEIASVKKQHPTYPVKNTEKTRILPKLHLMKRNLHRNLLRTLLGSGIIAACLCSCGPKHNTLTEAEIADGWQRSSHGKTLDQWKDSTAIR